jgi:hypothetical protein
MSITYSECVFVALGVQLAERMRFSYIVICSLSGCTVSSHIFSQTARVSGEKVTEHKMCVLIFSTTFV